MLRFDEKSIFTVSIFSIGRFHLNWMMHLEKTKSKKNGQLGQFFFTVDNNHDKVSKLLINNYGGQQKQRIFF